MVSHVCSYAPYIHSELFYSIRLYRKDKFHEEDDSPLAKEVEAELEDKKHK